MCNVASQNLFDVKEDKPKIYIPIKSIDNI